MANINTELKKLLGKVVDGEKFERLKAEKEKKLIKILSIRRKV